MLNTRVDMNLSHQDLKLRWFLACEKRLAEVEAPPIGVAILGGHPGLCRPKKNGRLESLCWQASKNAPQRHPTTRGSRGTFRWSDVIKGNPRNR